MKRTYLALPLILLSACTPKLSSPPETAAIQQCLDAAPRQTFDCWTAFSLPIPEDAYKVSSRDGGDFWVFNVNRKDGSAGMMIYNGHNPARQKGDNERYVADIAGERVKGYKIIPDDAPHTSSLEFYREDLPKDDLYHIIIHGSEEEQAIFLGMLRRMQLHPERPMPQWPQPPTP